MQPNVERDRVLLPLMVDAAMEDIAKLREALREAVYAMEDRDIFGDDPRITRAVNRANDVLRATEAKPEPIKCERCGGGGRIEVFYCEPGPCECGRCPDVDDCPECTQETD